ncbi:MAG: hypothetical protein A6F70_09905 [Cycloclasticus sp. symbiont of Bathymodiolus heckerae]|nr:MAG: hypothetical protein A6F70_09905 [Cycloclasticus sp. symbiont of Bathymodiolus heckerae]
MDKFTVMPQSINHNESPAFVANWFSGDEVQENREEDSFYYEADGGLGQLLICRIKWQDEKPQPEEYNYLMDRAIVAIDNWISERM